MPAELNCWNSSTTTISSIGFFVTDVAYQKNDILEVFDRTCHLAPQDKSLHVRVMEIKF